MAKCEKFMPAGYVLEKVRMCYLMVTMVMPLQSFASLSNSRKHASLMKPYTIISLCIEHYLAFALLCMSDISFDK